MNLVRHCHINWKAFESARSRRRLTVRDVEELTGVKRSTVSNIELGKHDPRGSDALKLYIFYELKPSDILLDKSSRMSNTLDRKG